MVRDGFILDFISGTNEVKETAKELVRQRIARALFHEYGISVEDMAPDFPVLVGGRRRRADVAVFGAGESHVPENIQRIVICRPEPKQTKRGAVKMRDYEQAAQDIDEVTPFFEEIDTCKYALWTNGLEFFFLTEEGDEDSRLRRSRLVIGLPADESIGERNVLSRALIPAAPIRRCCVRRFGAATTSFTAMKACQRTRRSGSFSISSSARCTMSARSSESAAVSGPVRRNSSTTLAARPFRKRIEPLFGEVKQAYKTIFGGGEEISLSDRALAFMISELSKYEFSRIDVDAKGAAYQEIVGTNLRGDRGQYFTPARRDSPRG